MGAPMTKPGKHGTLYLYAYVYRSASDHANHHTGRAWRYSLEHLEDAFMESNDGDDWELVTAQRVEDDGTRYGTVTHVPVHRLAPAGGGR